MKDDAETLRDKDPSESIHTKGDLRQAALSSLKA